MAASLKTDAELRQMFRERLVWDNPSAISSLRAKGLVQRIYAPSVRSVVAAMELDHVMQIITNLWCIVIKFWDHRFQCLQVR